MDTTYQGHGEYAGHGFGEHGDCLAGVAKYVRWLGVRLGLLMQLFDSWHLSSSLGDFESVANQHYSAVDAQDAGMNTENQSAPGLGELVQIEARAVQEVEIHQDPVFLFQEFP